jgi:chromosome segregation ATPase
MALFLAEGAADKNSMDTRGARELAKRIADEERRRNEAAAEAGAVDETGPGEDSGASSDPEPGSFLVAVERLQEEVAELKAELAARDDAIARLRMELSELRVQVLATADGSRETSYEAETDHVVFVSGTSSYGLLPREGRVPEVGSEIVLTDWAEGRYRVSKVGPSPLPGDRRRCAFLERVS